MYFRIYAINTRDVIPVMMGTIFSETLFGALDFTSALLEDWLDTGLNFSLQRVSRSDPRAFERRRGTS